MHHDTEKGHHKKKHKEKHHKDKHKKKHKKKKKSKKHNDRDHDPEKGDHSDSGESGDEGEKVFEKQPTHQSFRSSGSFINNASNVFTKGTGRRRRTSVAKRADGDKNGEELDTANDNDPPIARHVTIQEPAADDEDENSFLVNVSTPWFRPFRYIGNSNMGKRTFGVRGTVVVAFLQSHHHLLQFGFLLYI